MSPERHQPIFAVVEHHPWRQPTPWSFDTELPSWGACHLFQCWLWVGRYAPGWKWDQIRSKLDAASRKEQAEAAERARQRWLDWERDQFLAQEVADAEANEQRRKAQAKVNSGRASFPDQEGWKG